MVVPVAPDPFSMVDFTGFDDFVCGLPRERVGDPYCDNIVNSTGLPGLISATAACSGGTRTRSSSPMSKATVRRAIGLSFQ